MPSYSKESAMRLQSCHQDLQLLFHEVIKYFDHSVLWGYRGEADQNKFYRQGNSTKKYPDSKHNHSPSLAVDVAPYPIDWTDEKRFILLAGYVLGIASMMKIPIRWGGDWNRDTQVKDNRFNDLGHYELFLEKN
jgi:peptidoglycan L-alanyl-D-glutamate endopeptidase CwlK